MAKMRGEDMDKKPTKEMQTAVTRAFKGLLKSLEREPSVVIMEGSPEGNNNHAIREIVSWLFRRREENDD